MILVESVQQSGFSILICFIKSFQYRKQNKVNLVFESSKIVVIW